MDDILDINIKSYVLILREAFKRVIGDEYLDLLNEKLDLSMFIPYNNFRGIKKYREYLLACKRDTLMYDFFTTIGLDVSKYKDIRYDSPYYPEYEELIRIFLGTKEGFDFNMYKFGIMSFDNPEESDSLTEEVQISFINNYLFQGKNIVTRGNYHEFKTYNVYKNLLDSINKWLPIIKEKKKEYQEYKSTLEPLLDYVTLNEERLKIIEKENKKAVYQYIKENFKDEKWLKLYEENHPDEESRADILGNIDEYFGFRIFSGYYDKILETGDDVQKRDVMERRLKFFEDIGYLAVPVSSFKEVLESVYFEIMSSKEAIKLIPLAHLRRKLEKLKEELIKNSEKELIKEDYYFNKVMAEENFSKETIDKIAEALTIHPVLVSNADCNDKKIILLYYTIREYDGGTLDYLLIHEFVHIFEYFIKTFKISGFDHLNEVDQRKNPYNRNHRLYERFNEILSDLLAMEVLNVLHNVFQVYLLEDKSVLRSPINKNTSSILKNVLYPFYQKYFKVMIEAFMEEDLSILMDEIGEENFEALVDRVNYIDTLVSKFDLASDIENMRTSSVIYEFYLKALEEVMDIYENIEAHQEYKKRTLNN